MSFPEYAKLSIRHKLIVIVLLSLCIAGVMIEVMVITYSVYSERDTLAERLAVMSAQTAERSAAALAFVDQRAATDNLNALLSDSDVIYACLYSTVNRSVLAEVSRLPLDQSPSCLASVQDTQTMSLTEGFISHPVSRKGNVVGNLYMVVSLRAMWLRQWYYGLALLSAIFVSAVVAFMVAVRLQRSISGPISHLAEIANTISRDHNWNIRAKRESQDEMGAMVDAFNTMLSQLQRDKIKLEEMAFFDLLTGLPNRRLFKDRLEQALSRARRNRKMLAVAFVDLDHFKQVNDNLGHEQGDALLAEIAKRLQTSIRDVDTVARIGGDEFVIIINDIHSADNVDAIIEQILQRFKQPIHLDGDVLTPTASIGIAVSRGDDSIRQLLKHADVALYKVKAAGRDDYHVYTDDDDLPAAS